MKQYESIEPEVIENIIEALMKWAEDDLKEFGQSPAKILIFPPPPNNQVMTILPHLFGADHPRDVMPSIRASVEQMEEEEGKGYVAGVAAIAEAWMAKTSKEALNLTNLTPPSQRSDRIETVVCSFSTPDGSCRVSAREIKRNASGDFLGLGDEIDSGQGEIAISTVFNPWDNQEVLDSIRGFDGLSA